MGKQINYYLDVESFQKIAQAALEAGCLIVSGEFEPEPPKPSGDLTVIREELCYYYFYLPELGELNYKQSRAGRWCVDHLGEGANCLIEGAFSRKWEDRQDGRYISRQRLYVHTGYYDEEGLWIPRPERLTKVYDKLARLARK